MGKLAFLNFIIFPTFKHTFTFFTELYIIFLFFSPNKPWYTCERSEAKTDPFTFSVLYQYV
jgi:hypothetical protein